MQTLTRRGFFVIGGTGAAGVALAGCANKTDPRAEGRDPELLGAALAAETALGEAYGSGSIAAASSPAGASRAALDRFQAASEERSTELTRLLADSGGEAGGSEVSGSGDVIESANAAIAGYRAAAGPLSTEELRGTAIAFLAAVAAERAAISELAGEEPVPHAFVTGLPEDPYEADDDASDSEEEQ